MPATPDDVRRYLDQVLGLPIHLVGPWAGREASAYHLTEGLELLEARLAGRDIVLAFDSAEAAPTAGAVAARIAALRRAAARPVVYVPAHLAAFQRKRLIEAAVPFLVPGNQLFLPDLALDLREYFPRARRRPEGAMSPATQALLLSALGRSDLPARWTLDAVEPRLGYTAMTLSRAAGELIARGLAVEHRAGRRRWLTFAGDRREVWRRARSQLRTPVVREAWVRVPRGVDHTLPPLAGESALAERTLLVTPAHATRAVATARWRELRAAGLACVPEPVDGTERWQAWAYEPCPQLAPPQVDPLSLILSLQHVADERVQGALEELEDSLPW